MVTASAAVTVTGNVAVCVITGEEESCNSKVIGATDVAVGVPVIEPLASSTRPAASEPLLTDHR